MIIRAAAAKTSVISEGKSITSPTVSKDKLRQALNTAFNENKIMKTSKIFALVFVQYLQFWVIKLITLLHYLILLINHGVCKLRSKVKI